MEVREIPLGRLTRSRPPANKEPAGRGSRDKALSGLIATVQNERTKDYIQNRIIPQMEWYSKKSAVYKKQYFKWMTVSIILGALIPVFSVFSNADLFIKVLIAALGAGVTAINAYLSLHGSRDLWISYRTTRENLLHALYAYFNNAEVFSRDVEQSKKDVLLFQICENELSTENSVWKSTLDK